MSLSQAPIIRLNPAAVHGLCDAYAAGYRASCDEKDHETITRWESTLFGDPERTAFRRGLQDGQRRHYLRNHKAEALHILHEESILWRLGACLAVDFLTGSLPGRCTMDRAMEARAHYTGHRGTVFCDAFDVVMEAVQGFVDPKAIVTPLAPADVAMVGRLHAWLDASGVRPATHRTEEELIERLASILAPRT